MTAPYSESRALEEAQRDCSCDRYDADACAEEFRRWNEVDRPSTCPCPCHAKVAAILLGEEES